jgi:hypothetical protein
MLDRAFDLQADRLVCLAEMLAALGVAEFDDIEIAVLEHRRGDFTGPGAG